MSSSRGRSAGGKREHEELVTWVLLAAVVASLATGFGAWWHTHRDETIHRVLTSRDLLASDDIKALDALTVQPEDPITGYQRELFGADGWPDTDRNGCDQRDDVLARDLDSVVRSGKCTVVSGTLIDPYDGTAVPFVKTNATAVQIDHVVSLGDAWKSGADHWTAAQRRKFATDETNLAATSRHNNTAKGDRDAALWQPTGAARMCRYAQDVVRTKTTYNLSVDQREADALRGLLAQCP